MVVVLAVEQFAHFLTYYCRQWVNANQILVKLDFSGNYTSKQLFFISDDVDGRGWMKKAFLQLRIGAPSTEL